MDAPKDEISVTPVCLLFATGTGLSVCQLAYFYCVVSGTCISLKKYEPGDPKRMQRNC